MKRRTGRIPRSIAGWTRITPELTSVLALDDSDLCFYLLVRKPGGRDASPENAAISDFKTSPGFCQSSPHAVRRKQSASLEFANHIVELLSDRRFLGRVLGSCSPIALVPMPTHLPQSSPLHDDRLIVLCSLAAAQLPLEVSCIPALDTASESIPSHTGGTRNVDAIKANTVLHLLKDPTSRKSPAIVVLVDDILTTGAHFVACRELIEENYPGIPIVGLFLAMHESDKVAYPHPLKQCPPVWTTYQTDPQMAASGKHPARPSKVHGWITALPSTARQRKRSPDTRHRSLAQWTAHHLAASRAFRRLARMLQFAQIETTSLVALYGPGVFGAGPTGLAFLAPSPDYLPALPSLLAYLITPWTPLLRAAGDPAFPYALVPDWITPAILLLMLASVVELICGPLTNAVCDKIQISTGSRR